MISAPQALADHHRLDGFTCGKPTRDTWLAKRARQNQANHSSRTYVVCDGDVVVGYYCLAAGAISHAEAPGALRRNRPDPIPVMVLGRLAIANGHQGSGVGTALLRDAMLRALGVAEIVGAAALLVHAIDDDAVRFYRSRGFLESPVQAMTLCLPIATVAQAIRPR